MRHVFLPLAATGALLSGCVDLAPPYDRPIAPIPSHFRAPGVAGPPAAWSAMAGWRDFFLDPKLREIISQALGNNRDLRVAVANIEAARALYGVERSLEFPSVSAGAGASYGAVPTSVAAGRAPPAGAPEHQNQRLYRATVGVSAFELDLFGRARNVTRAAQDRYFATREARDAVQIAIVSEVAADYLALGADQTLLQIAQATLHSSSETLALAQRRLDAGVSSELDVSQAQTFAEAARSDVARLTAQVLQDRNALELVVGDPVPDESLPNEIPEAVGLLDRLPPSMDAAILLLRPDVLAAEAGLQAANADIGAARAAFFPHITLTGAGGLSSLALSDLFMRGASTWTFAPAVSQTLFDGGARRGNLAYARAQRDLGVATYEKAVQTAFREVADALAVRSSIDDQLAAQTALNAAASQSLAIAQARYVHGSDSYLNVLVAQRTLYAARQSLTATRRSRALNLVTLYAALGGGLEGPLTIDALLDRAQAERRTPRPAISDKGGGGAP